MNRLFKIFLCLIVLCVMGGVFSFKKIKRFREKAYFRKAFNEVKNIHLQEEGGYVDVDRWIALRQAYKKERKAKGLREHLRLADVSLNHSPLRDSFFTKLQNPPKWMLDQIDEEFASYQMISSGGIDEMIAQFKKEADWESKYLLAKYKIYKGRLYVKDFSKNHNVLKYMNTAFCRLHNTISLPDMEFLLTFRDYYDLKDIPAPFFVFSKKKDNHFMIMIPDHEMLTGYETFDAKLDKSSQKSPWETKEEIAFWRGATTSGDFTESGWRKFPRPKLVYQSLDHAEYIDARFSKLVQGAESNPDFLSQPDLQGDFVYPEDSLKYKYLIDIDGNASTYSHLYWVLRSNCVPFKQESPYTMWYHAALMPYQHYIPYDLANLPSQVKWAREHDDQAHQIADASTQFAQEHLTLDDAYVYLYLVLQKYHSLYDVAF